MKNSRYKTLRLLCSHYVITKAAEAHSSWMHSFYTSTDRGVLMILSQILQRHEFHHDTCGSSP